MDCYRPAVPSSFDLLVGGYVFKIEVICLDDDLSALSGRLASVAVPASRDNSVQPPAAEDRFLSVDNPGSGERDDDAIHPVDLTTGHRSKHAVISVLKEYVPVLQQQSLPTSTGLQRSLMSLPPLDLDPSRVLAESDLTLNFAASVWAYSTYSVQELLLTGPGGPSKFGASNHAPNISDSLPLLGLFQAKLSPLCLLLRTDFFTLRIRILCVTLFGPTKW